MFKCESRGWRSSAKHQSFSFDLHSGAPLNLNATTETIGLGLGLGSSFNVDGYVDISLLATKSTRVRNL